MTVGGVGGSDGGGGDGRRRWQIRNSLVVRLDG